jgi:hypothetical protein
MRFIIYPKKGWSHYSFEGINITCSVEWREKSLNVISFNVTILLLVFVIPLVLIIAVDFSVLYLVSINNKQEFKILLQIILI